MKHLRLVTNFLHHCLHQVYKLVQRLRVIPPILLDFAAFVHFVDWSLQRTLTGGSTQTYWSTERYIPKEGFYVGNVHVVFLCKNIVASAVLEKVYAHIKCTRFSFRIMYLSRLSKKKNKEGKKILNEKSHPG